MKHDSYLVGDLVAEFLAANGLQTAFGIISVHNIPIMDGIRKRDDVKMVMTRGETGAAHMADGCARAGGGVGVVISSTGPGASNTVPGLVEAQFAGTPLLHITGQTATPHIGRGQGTVHDVPGQLGILSNAGKAAYRAASADTVLGTLKRALLEATTAPMGPISVEIPIDVQRAPIQRPSHPEAFLCPPPLRRTPAKDEIESLANCLRAARKPMLWVGSGARAAAPQIARLLEMGCSMVSSWAGRGIMDDAHPRNLGALNGPGSPEVQELYAQADLLLVLGSRLRGHETLDMKLSLPANLVQVDADPMADARSYPNTLFVCGDIELTLEALLTRLEDGGALAIDNDFQTQVENAKQLAADVYRDTLGPYKTFPEQLRGVVPQDAIWARDITLSNSTWGHRLFPLREHRQNIYPVGAGIGQGLQLGIGAALARTERKTVLLTGDGGFFFNMTELWTAVQEQADIVMIVMNDGGYGVIKHMQEAMCDGRQAYGDLLAPDLLKLAELAGIPGLKVSAADQFGPVVAQALAEQGPVLVEVDMLAIGAFPPYYPYSEMIEKARKHRA